MQGKNATGHSSLCEMCSTATAIQLQLWLSYQYDQHLRDVLLNACKDEPWYHRLATVEISRLIDVEESIARAISGEEGFRLTTKTKPITPACIKDVNHVKDRPGMPSRKQSKNNSQQQDRKKNPVVNYRRLLCRNCLSDEHLLRNCDRISNFNRMRLVNHMFSLNSMSTTDEACREAMDIIQNFGHGGWKECLLGFESGNESEAKSKEENENFEYHTEAEINLTTSCGNENCQVPDSKYRQSF